MVCKTLNILPSNPDFINMTYSQIQWLKENIIYDFNLENEAYSKAMKKSDTVEVEGGDYSNEEMVEIMRQRRKDNGGRK